MDNMEKLKKLCNEMMGDSRKISPKDFYEGLKEISEREDPDSDLACLLEDAMMDLEMDGSPECARETAKGITEEINGHF